ncbi:MAG: formate--phosphoribosylaminoimidazolecarboxamide ligase [Candidatus Heimdallarchaeum aukensis]|uniref:Formate--phosphoribosylaminoimidazolecarboxamide ligase n=1 Tax=Candidatus Heimdallarchaeum aukensis TaxID=2876573 RepID=A0A9Y1FK42_9ARCH|nr:MAG: formate--phosphoribosylaminoimidazolecarboxamide ligase [Candidatus Heimdallarchaeum aukensis]
MIISTVGSHSALQILYGAKKESFSTKVYCLKGKEQLYKRYPVADQIITLDSYSDLLDRKYEGEEIFVPHGSIIATLGKRALDIPIPMIGNREGMYWEMVREKNLELLNKAKIRTPYTYKPEEIDRLCIVKFPGAKGGDGYFLCSSYQEFEGKIDTIIKEKKVSEEEASNAQIQEYIVGVTMYPHYFYSPIFDRVELLGIDRRYETNVDALGRLSQSFSKIYPTYTVVGNQPLIARESLLHKILDYGDLLREVSVDSFHPGLIGPYCIEMALTDKEIVAFEFTSRIVAGTSLYISGSLYSKILFDEEMSMGRRIAREIKLAKEQNRLDDIIS